MSEPLVGQIIKQLRNLRFRRLLGAAGLGLTVACLPLTLRYVPENGVFGSVTLGIELLAAPGAMVNIVTAGNVHGGSLWVVYAANFGLYSWLFYILLGIWLNRQVKL
jgi:ABC-type Fe3+-siderophore transport system permease subunit